MGMNSSPAISSKITVYSTPSKIQNFSLPENIIFYISKNPKLGKVYEKLINLCKYFYLKNPSITFKNIKYEHFLQLWQIHKIYGKSNSKKFYNLKTLPEKTLLNGSIKITDTYLRSDIVPYLTSKIYQCDLRELILSHQILTLKQFKFFTSSKGFKKLVFNTTIVRNYDDGGKIEPIEKLIEIVPNLEYFKYFHDTDPRYDETLYPITSETAKKLIEIPHFQKLKSFKLGDIREYFDFETFFNGLKKPWKLEIILHFNQNLPQFYNQKLEKFIDQIISACVTDSMPPLILNHICYHKYVKLCDLRKVYLELNKQDPNTEV